MKEDDDWTDKDVKLDKKTLLRRSAPVSGSWEKKIRMLVFEKLFTLKFATSHVRNSNCSNIKKAII